MWQSSILVDACFNAESIGTISSSWHVVVVEKFHKNVLAKWKIPDTSAVFDVLWPDTLVAR